MQVLMAGTIVITGIVFSDLFAHRDEVSARRFRELNPDVVTSEIDLDRNIRWHTLGAIQRTAVCAVAAFPLGVAEHSLLAGVLAAVSMGGTVAVCFDVFFNLRFAKPWWYTGTTSAVDVAIANHAKLVAAGKLAVAIAGTAAFLYWV